MFRILNISLAQIIACAMALFLPGLAQGASFHVLYAFQGGVDGASPWDALLTDSKGNLYGTTNVGGNTGCGGTGCGTVFKLGPHRKERVIYAFCAVQNCIDGANPYAGLLADQKGNLYGTTKAGGAGCNGIGCGTVFRVSSRGTETVIYAFCAQPNCADGEFPNGGLLQNADGVFFGTTEVGGVAANRDGTVFSLKRDGMERVLYSFCSAKSCSDGATPAGNLIVDMQGNIFGTTENGGASGGGILFRMAKNGAETVLYSFDGGVGQTPSGGLISDQKGNFYGTASSGGGISCNGTGCGSVFMIAPNGAATLLYAFTGGNDGAYPQAAPVADQQGNLYGTTAFGGGTGCSNLGCGTVFKVAPNGTETMLHHFTGGSDGGMPVGGLILLNGYLYGTTTQGGTINSNCSNGCGVVFRVKK